MHSAGAMWASTPTDVPENFQKNCRVVHPYAMRENFRTEEAPTRCFETRTTAAGFACGRFCYLGISYAAAVTNASSCVFVQAALGLNASSETAPALFAQEAACA